MRKYFEKKLKLSSTFIEVRQPEMKCEKMWSLFTSILNWMIRKHQTLKLLIVRNVSYFFLSEELGTIFNV